MSIEHISDTARWVAVYRAMESERTDAIFRDPFAKRLAGVEGVNIVDSLPKGRQMAWTMIVRTALFDELVLNAVRAEGIGLIVNLAAGLDARPWRLDLPHDLLWFDVDLPGILDHKLGGLADEQPTCSYSAVRADLTNVATRREMLEQIGATAQRALVLTEGLLTYLISRAGRGPGERSARGPDVRVVGDRPRESTSHAVYPALLGQGCRESECSLPIRPTGRNRLL